MPTRLMLIRDSAPLPGARVKIKGVEGDFRSNDDGMVEVPVETDIFSVAVHDTEDWIVKKVRRTKSTSMVVVDLSANNQKGRRWDLTDRYSFEQVLGRGGMGVVVRASDNVLQRPVAIKMLSDEFLENEEAQELFMTEGRAMATLSHPNLVTVHDVTRASGRVLMVLEFVDGQNVESLLNDRGVLPTAEALSITIQVLKALEYLHTQGVIHRDLKPGNFMINEAGTVKVIDFGLARSLEDMWDKGTRVRGTPAYMAPEQIRGEQMSAATDIYQMGVSFWELLTGELPYSGEQLYAHVHEKVPRVRDVDATMDPEIDDVLWSCLQKDPSQRPQSTAALRAQLESVYYRIATDPNLGTAATAHMVESDLTRDGRNTEALMPDTPADLGTHPSGSQLISPSKPSAVNESELEIPPTKSSRIGLFALVILLLVAVGGVGAYSSGMLSSDERVATGTSETPPSQNEGELAGDSSAESEQQRLEESPEDLSTAFTLAQRTIGSSVSASRAGSDVVDRLRQAEAQPPKSAPRTSDSTGEAAPKDSASKSSAEKRKVDKDSAPASSDSSDETVEGKAEAAANTVSEPSSKSADEPAVFEPKPFAPKDPTAAADSQSSKKTQKKKKDDESTKKSNKKPAEKPAEKATGDEKEKETETKVPVSF